jgi:hypothetical protein
LLNFTLIIYISLFLPSPVYVFEIKEAPTLPTFLVGWF